MRHDVITVVLLLAMVLGYVIFTHQGNDEAVTVYEPNNLETPSLATIIHHEIADVLTDYTVEEIRTKRDEITTVLNGRLEKYGIVISDYN